MIYFLLLPYALFRWGSGREAAAGLVIILVAATLGIFVSWTGVGDAIGGTAVLLSSFALGLAVRSQHGARQRRLEQVKTRGARRSWHGSCTTRSPTTSRRSPSRLRRDARSRRPARARRSKPWR